MTGSGTTAEFAYNADGLRVRKTVNGISNGVAVDSMLTEYILHGKQVVHVKQGDENLHFYYDAKGRPAVVQWGGMKYGYVHNLQGDIVAIIDGSGNAVVEYTYDAWGSPLTKTGALAASLGTLNPFRYRGYVYDEETGLYYLRSRFYNPMWGRFLNADNCNELSRQLLSCNLYTYCMNNVVCSSDVNGKFPAYINKVFELYGGWNYIFHNDHGKPIGDGKFLEHVHIYNDKARLGTFSLNSDGSYHDDEGDPPNKVKKKLKEKTGWDWDKMRDYYDNGYKIEMIPGTDILVVKESPSPLTRGEGIGGGLLPIPINPILPPIFSFKWSVPSYIPAFP